MALLGLVLVSLWTWPSWRGGAWREFRSSLQIFKINAKAESCRHVELGKPILRIPSLTTRKTARKFANANGRHFGLRYGSIDRPPPGLQSEDRGDRNLSVSRGISLGGEFLSCVWIGEGTCLAVGMAPRSAAIYNLSATAPAHESSANGPGRRKGPTAPERYMR